MTAHRKWCDVQGCDERHYCQGYCKTHYVRVQTHGDPQAHIPLRRNRTQGWRFWSKVDVREPDECWPWLASLLPSGYGSFIWDGRRSNAHRIAYQLFFGPVPDDLVVDHLCRNRACVNPAHMEPVTNKENVLRGSGPFAINARKTHCIRGHEFTPENTRIDKSGLRKCRQCHAAQERGRRAARKAAA